MMEYKEEIEEKVNAILENVKAFLKERNFSYWEEKSRRIYASMFIRRRLALYSLTGELPIINNPRIKQAQFLKLLQNSEELEVKGFKGNQKIGKMTIPTIMMTNYIEWLDSKIWGEVNSWGREYSESEWKNIDDVIIYEKSHTKKRQYSKSSFLGEYCKGWYYELKLHEAFESDYERLVFIYDILNAYGIGLIDKDYNEGNPTNKDKQQYIKGLIKPHILPLIFFTKWNYDDPSEWANFL